MFKGVPVPRKTHKTALVLIFVAASFLATGAAAEDFPPQIQAGQHRLSLNGWGARSQYFLDLYVAGLYLIQSSSDPAAIADANDPMAIRIKVTSGFVSQPKLVKSLTDGFRNATGGNVAPIQTQIEAFRKCFADPISKGDTFDLVYLPEHGTVVNKNGKLKGVVTGVEFKQALFNIWLSDKPADKALKQAMLSKTTRR